MIIVIDGPSGTGKSTVAKAVAKKLGFTFFDTGAMYRSLAWWILQSKISSEEEQAIAQKLPEFHYEIKKEGDDRRYLVGGVDVTEVIRSHEISTAASKIAAYPEVRRAIVRIQRRLGRPGDAVFEGRDMGTVVFPEAEVKIFLTATPECRAERRYRELLEKFPDFDENFSLPQILRDIEERDRNDSTRAISPLKKADNALLIDTSELTAEQVAEKIVAIAKSKPVKKTRFKHALYYIVYSLAKIYFKLFYRLKIHGLDHFRPGAAIIAANHASNLDPPAISVSCPEEVHFLAKDSLFRIPLLGFLIKHLNSHPITREAGDAHTFRLIINLLQKGQKVILFPEGKRTSDGELQPIERGLPFLAIKARCAIQPVYIQGTFKAWPKGQAFPTPWGRVTCVFGSLIEWDEFEHLEKKAAEKQIIDRMDKTLHALKFWFESGAQGAPP